MNLKFWTPVALSIPITMVCLLVGLGSAGVGHGSGLPILVLFPYSLTVVTLVEALGYRETGLVFGLALVLQFPLYGFIIALAIRTRKLILAAVVLVVMHLAVAGYQIHASYYNAREGLEASVPVKEIELDWPPLGSRDQPLGIDREKLEEFKLPEGTPTRGHTRAMHRYDYLKGTGNCSDGSTVILYHPQDDLFFLIGDCDPMEADLPEGPFRGDPRKVLPQVTNLQPQSR